MINTYRSLLECDFKKLDIFVFGSNTEGRHGKGAAKFALLNCGAWYGQARGIQGNSYAIVTKDLKKKFHPSIHTSSIVEEIMLFYDYAKKNSDLKFYVAYSGTGINLNGYSSSEMADMFTCSQIPDNVYFEVEFAQLVRQHLTKSLF